MVRRFEKLVCQRIAGTLFVDTIGIEEFDYEQNQVVLDRVARSIEVTHDEVEADPAVVARYEGGGGAFSVEGEVRDSEACLRIPPEGDQLCTDVPEPQQLLTIQLEDLEPVLAGVAGEGVFRVTHSVVTIPPSMSCQHRLTTRTSGDSHSHSILTRSSPSSCSTSPGNSSTQSNRRLD